MSEDVIIQKDNGVLEITLARGKANAISNGLSRELGQIFREFRDDPSLKVALITGRGEKFFCPGWDLKAAAEGEQADGDYGVGGFGGLQELPNLNKPVIAAINGICCGGGFEIALSCDLIIAADHATFALPEINVGVFADAATIKLPKRIPYHVAMDLLLTGRWMDAPEAKQWGLVRDIVPLSELMPTARQLARLLADGPPLVFQAIKQVVRESVNMGIQDAFNATRDGRFSAVYKCNHSDDMLEGTRAFAEKRKPRWSGK